MITPAGMKKIITIILVSINLVAQAQQTAMQPPYPTKPVTAPTQKRIVFEKPDDVAKHVWAGIMVNWATGSLIYAKTKNIPVSLAGGFLGGVLAGVIKEAVWDGMLKRGVCDNNDAYATFWGSAVGTVSLRIGIDVHERKKIDREYFYNLGPGMQVVDTLVIEPGDTTFLVAPKPINYN